jgi:AsmA protein
MTNSDVSFRPFPRGLILFVGLVLLVVCAVVLPPLVNANRLRGRLATSLSSALGRPVQMDNVTLRLLPRPGFAFENLEVAEDPAFGAEPVMRAATVTVGVRLLPLWRGRIELATVTLDQASLNVARNSEGRWNFESLLERTSQLPAQLPTAQHRTRAGARFPYFEVTNGRINFKRGSEKLPFSFTDAEFSLWLETTTEWRLRFRAAPVRTDLDAGYTGELRMEGSVQRDPGRQGQLSENQIALEGSWLHAPLGQWTRMMQGHDGGWRGDSSLDFTLRGTADSALASARVRVDGLRRDDFVPATSVVIDAACNAQLSLLQRIASHSECDLPAESGSLRLTAENLRLERNANSSASSLTLLHVPANWLLDALRLVRQGISPELMAHGEVNGAFTYANAGLPHGELAGSAVWTKGSVTIPTVEQQRMLPELRIDTGNDDLPARGTRKSRTRIPEQAPSTRRITLQPVDMQLGGSRPLRVQGSLTSGSYFLAINGGLDLAIAAPLLRSLGFARWSVLHKVSGDAEADLRVQDNWMRLSNGAPAQVRGTVALRNVKADTAWLPGPVQVAKAEVTLSDGGITWKEMQWSWAGATFNGSAIKPTLCEDAASCAWHLTAHTAALDLAKVQAQFQPSGADRFVDFFRAGGPGGWPLFEVDLSADSLEVGPMAVSHASAELTASGSMLKLGQCSGAVLGGSMECSGTVALANGESDLSIGLARVSLANAGLLFHEKWGKGTLEASLNLKLRQGSSASGDFTAMLRDASLSGAAPSTPLARIDSWQLAGTLGDGKVTLDRSVLSSGSNEIPIMGSIGFDRRLDLRMTPHDLPTRHISGAVQAPVIQ